MRKLILLVSLFICNFTFSQIQHLTLGGEAVSISMYKSKDTTIVPSTTFILDKIEIRSDVIKIWITDLKTKESILYEINDGKVKSLKYTISNF